MTQIAPISAAQHYATSAAFWEQQAKLLQHQLDEERARTIELERRLAEQDVPAEEGQPNG